MQRITMTVDEAQLATLDAYAVRRGYTSRSEAMRDILREVDAGETAVTDPSAPCLATLTYIYEHETRELSRRLTAAQHRHHDLSISTLHVHVDHEDCLEVVVLRGAFRDIRSFADEVVTQRGVRMGNLHVIPVGRQAHEHVHGHEHGREHGRALGD